MLIRTYIWAVRGPVRRRYQFSTIGGVVVDEKEGQLGGKRALYIARDPNLRDATLLIEAKQSLPV